MTITKTNFESEVLKSEKPVMVDFLRPVQNAVAGSGAD